MKMRPGNWSAFRQTLFAWTVGMVTSHRRARSFYAVKYDYVLFCAGLALIAGPPPLKLTGVRSYHPEKGLD